MAQPQIVILSRKDAVRYEPSDREVCISITDFDDHAPPVLSGRFISVLRLAFSDIDEPDADPTTLLFNDTHAKAILRFVQQWKDADRLVIHCMAGQSRSPGVAIALCELFSWTLDDIEERYPWANPRVRQVLVRVGRDVMARSDLVAAQH